MGKMNNIFNQIANGLAFGWHMAGYGTGYSVTTGKLYTKELVHKVREAKVVATFADGYVDGSDHATWDYYARKAKAYAKAQDKADKKAAEEALNEMYESMMNTEEEEQVEEPAPKVTVETKEASKSLLGQDMMTYFMNAGNNWRLTFNDASIVGAAQYARDNQRAYVFQEGVVISQYIPTGYCAKYVLKGTSTIVALEYADGTRIDLFDNGFIVTK